ncbi:hypothetical protein P8452_12127 [Trifolium repens]|jgi:hypothetical protein|nr:hypothetical protein P8452_12127 [Trifolium repens]
MTANLCRPLPFLAPSLCYFSASEGAGEKTPDPQNPCRLDTRSWPKKSAAAATRLCLALQQTPLALRGRTLLHRSHHYGQNKILPFNYLVVNCQVSEAPSNYGNYPVHYIALKVYNNGLTT